jgi:hypothetical protein
MRCMTCEAGGRERLLMKPWCYRAQGKGRTEPQRVTAWLFLGNHERGNQWPTAAATGFYLLARVFEIVNRLVVSQSAQSRSEAISVLLVPSAALRRQIGRSLAASRYFATALAITLNLCPMMQESHETETNSIVLLFQTSRF